jgi:hypothetical protein
LLSSWLPYINDFCGEYYKQCHYHTATNVAAIITSTITTSIVIVKFFAVRGRHLGGEQRRQLPPPSFETGLSSVANTTLTTLAIPLSIDIALATHASHHSQISGI